MKNIKYLSLAALSTSLIFSHGTFASGKDDDSGHKSIGQKIGKETRRVVDQVKEEAKNVKESWKQKAAEDKAAQEKQEKEPKSS